MQPMGRDGERWGEMGRDRLVRRNAVQPRPLCEHRRRVQTPHALVLLARLVDDSDGELVARKDHLGRDDAE